MVFVVRRPVALVEVNVFEVREEELAFLQYAVDRQSFLVVDDDVLD